jgi:hypothetical protein
MRSMRKRDVYGTMQRWIMTVKDHSTGLVYLAPLPRKKAEYVAAELEKYFGFAGFPHILHTDNGKEFIATLVVDMMMRHNPNCFLVTGRPRTPRDQGSVESGNKVVQRVLMAICRQRRMEGIQTNWTRILGQVMSVCNSHSGIRKFSTSSYEAVFGLPYYPELRCTVAEMRQCNTIEQRLRLSPDERLATYVREHDIVDYITELGGASLVSDLDDNENDGDDENEGVDVTDYAFPEAFADKDLRFHIWVLIWISLLLPNILFRTPPPPSYLPLEDPFRSSLPLGMEKILPQHWMHLGWMPPMSPTTNLLLM